MTQISENWGELLEPGLRKIFNDTYNDYPSMIPELFSVQRSSKAEEHDLGIGALGDIPKFEGTVEYDDFYKQYKTTYSPDEYAGGIQIERKLVDDDQFNIINKKPQALATALRRTREKSGAGIFNNAFSTASFTGGDAVALCSDAHPVTSSSTTYDNKGAYSLGKSNVETVKQLMMDFVDDRGNIIVVTPDTILIPPNLYESAYEIVKTPAGLDSAEGNANVHYGQYKLVVWHYLTDTNNWYLIDSQLMKQSLFWFDRILPEFAMEKDFDTFTSKYRAYARWSCGFSDWRWLFGNQCAA